MGRDAHNPVVAIVDDDLSLRHALRSLVASAGYDARTFESASAFLGAGNLSSVACLVLDMYMPGLSGLALQTVLIAMKVNIPIIFITARVADVRAVALARGAVAVLSKPACPDALLRAIEKVAPLPSGKVPMLDLEG
jgi:FixJ family two-component response regulator